MKRISYSLWFDSQAEEAAKLYTTVFENSKTVAISHYGKSGAEVSGQKEGSVLVVNLNLEGLEIEALNGGPQFKFTPAMSPYVNCKDAHEIESKYKKLSAGG